MHIKTIKKQYFKCGVSRREFWTCQFTRLDCTVYVDLFIFTSKHCTIKLIEFYNKIT